MSYFPIPHYDPQTLVRSITVDIDAPTDVVWRVLVDLERYPLWNPFCLSAVSTLRMGAPPVEMLLADYARGGRHIHQYRVRLRDSA